MRAKKSNVQRIVVDKDMTIYNVAVFKKQWLEALNQTSVLELDLSQVAEIDTAGIQLLILTKREAQLLARTMAIVAHSPAVSDIIDFCNMAAYFGDPLLIQARETT
ncbi:MAG: putative binding protein (contains domain) [Proteobacteria bacterium]|nr:putative binding protein (contains domain) [Pseudomonadota bacterium]